MLLVMALNNFKYFSFYLLLQVILFLFTIHRNLHAYRQIRKVPIRLLTYHERSDRIRSILSQRMQQADTSSTFGGNFGSKPYTAVLIVPTGIGARIGGYAGDALPSARLLATVADVLITHPNVMNGAMLYWPQNNILYVEGCALDYFAEGKWGLQPLQKRGHSIGLLLDKAIEHDLILRHIQVADAARATLGINVHHCTVTKRPVGVKICMAASGASWGTVEDTAALTEAAEHLIKQGCTAIAVVVRFPEDDEEEGVNSELFDLYRKGQGVDSIAGVEALISHIITKRYKIPCAHAPAFASMEVDDDVSPKACAEEIGYTFLPCVLANLHRAPAIVDSNTEDGGGRNHALSSSDVDAVVVPCNALGGPAVLAFLEQEKEVLIIAVEENVTSMQVTSKALLDNNHPHKHRIVSVRSYAEAAGLLAAHKSGIFFPSITDKVETIAITRL